MAPFALCITTLSLSEGLVHDYRYSCLGFDLGRNTFPLYIFSHIHSCTDLSINSKPVFRRVTAQFHFLQDPNSIRGKGPVTKYRGVTEGGRLVGLGS
ncbi:hypothetical protein VNO80_19508 [Phaseolus coccineus]|uniref:Uncharacterized protein n=1 Tax=Phaseolus coccineus TaxID=3886 RepID=A0AAN9MLC0_PHACN